jgi:SagB-type dehydrogenase family enzyme
MKPYVDYKRPHFVLCAAVLFVVLFAVILPAYCETPKRIRPGEQKVIQLPEPNRTGPVSLEAAVNTRRNTRQFNNTPLTYSQIGQLAWAGQGLTDKKQGLRAAPSAGDIYPIELYFVTQEGLFIYNPDEHSLKQLSLLDMRKQLSAASSERGPVEDAACDIVIAGSVRKVAAKYGNKAQKIMQLEAGQVTQNIQLQAVSLGLGSLSVGSFEIRNISRACELPADFEPLLIICVGHPFVQQKPQDQNQSASGQIKKAVLIVPPAQFSDSELSDTQRILADAGVTAVVASSKIGALQGVFGGIAASEITIDKVVVQDYDAVVFIGGPGAADYFDNSVVISIVRKASDSGKVIAAIGAAPTILANAGILRGIRATGLPQQREQMKKQGAQYTGSAVERDGLIITANDSAVASQFARSIVTAVKSNQPKLEKTPAK